MESCWFVSFRVDVCCGFAGNQIEWLSRQPEIHAAEIFADDSQDEQLNAAGQYYAAH